MKNHEEKAVDLFYEGYNCSQATFVSFADVSETNPKEMARIASSFGGGMGKMGEVCGALTGAFMAIGSKLGYSDPTDKASKAKHYELIREVADRFKAKKGSIYCRDLLKLNETNPQESSRPTPKQCEHYVRFAAKLVDEVFQEHNIE